MDEDVPWPRYLAAGAAVLGLVLAFQWLARGEVTPSIAVTVAVGYVVVRELVRRRE